MTVNQLVCTGLAIASAIGAPALAWEPGEPFPKGQCGPQPATIGPDVTVCQAKDSAGNQYLSVRWSHETPPTFAAGPCSKESKLPTTSSSLSQKGARMWVEFYCNWVDWD